MITELIVYIILGFVGIRLVVSIVNALSMLYLPDIEASKEPLVSVMIPARNEAANLPVLLEQLVNQEYSNLEILVYDDHSDDNTSSIVQLYQKRDSRVRLISPKTLPSGWLGKNFGCHTLAQNASGEYFLFLDADVKISLKLINNAIGYVQQKQLSLLSIFPTQKMYSRGEWLTVPIMNWVLLSLLPMKLIKKSKNSAFAAANGQFMLFYADAYKANNWHEQVKDNLVEDITIIKRMKSLGYSTMTLLGDKDITCRMYNSYGEGIDGFAKNVIEFFGGSIAGALLFSIFMVSGVALPFLNGLEVFFFYILMIVLMRIFIALASRQNVGKNILYHIPQMVTFLVMVWKGIQVKSSGKYLWKGRAIE